MGVILEDGVAVIDTTSKNYKGQEKLPSLIVAFYLIATLYTNVNEETWIYLIICLFVYLFI